MEDFLKRALLFVNDFRYGFYGACLVGLFLYFRRAREASRIRRYTPFPIEREEASAMLRDSLIILTILLAILVTTFYIDRILLPTSAGPESPFVVEAPPTVTATSPAIGAAPESTPLATAAESATSTPEPPPPAESPTVSLTLPEATATPEPTAPPPTSPPAPTATIASPTIVVPTATLLPTLPPEPSATALPATAIPTRPPEPTAPPVPAASCNTPGVRITSPAHGQVVSGDVSIFGTADIDRFQFYKVEFGQGGNPGSFAVVEEVVRQAVREGFLANWRASTFSSGIWTLRLTAVDETGNFPPPCDVRVIIP